MGSLCSKSSQISENDINELKGKGKSLNEIKKEFLKKYGRLDWDCSEITNEEKAKSGKRYEGLQVLMNLRSSHILTCNVIKVTQEGFLVEPINISGFTEEEPEKFDWKQPIPFSKFYHIFLVT